MYLTILNNYILFMIISLTLLIKIVKKYSGSIYKFMLKMFVVILLIISYNYLIEYIKLRNLNIGLNPITVLTTSILGIKGFILLVIIKISLKYV